MNEKLPPLRIGQLESEFPIVIGGMSINLGTKELSAAGANNGGFGTMGAVGLGMIEGTRNSREYFQNSQEILGQEIHDALEISNNGNIGVNIMVAATDYEELVKVSVESGAKYIASGAGLPLRLPEYVEKYRVHGQPTPELIPIVSSARAGELILKRWSKNGVTPAAFVVETPNTAGGHLGVSNPNDIGKDEYSLEIVVPQLVKSIENSGYDIPVIAAGGVWDRDDIDNMLKIGARGVQLATRFITTEECNASQAFKDRHAYNTDPIKIIKSPVGMPGRAIENDFLRRVEAGEEIDLGPCVNCLKVCEHRESRKLKNQNKIEKFSSFCIARALCIVQKGYVENGILFIGSNSNRLKIDRENGIFTTKQVMQELTRAKLNEK